MFHQEFDLSRQRALDMRTEVGRNRLESRLRSARREEAKAGAYDRGDHSAQDFDRPRRDLRHGAVQVRLV